MSALLRLRVVIAILLSLGVPIIGGCNRLGPTPSVAQRLAATRQYADELVSSGGAAGMVQADTRLLKALNSVAPAQLHVPVPSDATLFHNIGTGDYFLLARWLEATPTVEKVVVISPDGSETVELVLSTDDIQLNELFEPDGVSFNLDRPFPRGAVPQLLAEVGPPGVTSYRVTFVDRQGRSTLPIPLVYSPHSGE